MKKTLFTLAMSLGIFGVALSQTVSITKVELVGENIIVFYTLEDNTPNREYLLNLYSSRDNYATPLTKVTGDVGPEVRPGMDKKIIWNVRQEFGGYKGRIALEIRGRVYTAFVKLNGFEDGKTFKKGKTYNISWQGNSTNPLHIELFQGVTRIQGEMNHPNNGLYVLTVPKTKSGKNYRLKFTNSKNGEEVVYTPYFRISPKLPVGAKAAVGLIAVGGVGYFLLSPKPKDEGIPDPPFPKN